jgi:NAD-specific glutamate dehydrogenase
MTLEALPMGGFTLKYLESVFGAPEAAKRGFLAAVLEDFRPGELPDVTPDDLAEALESFWRWGEARQGAATAIRLIRASGAGGRDLGLDLLEIVQPDARFLVDSVMGEAAEASAEVLAMFHPVVAGPAGPTSMIQIWLAPVAEERRAGLVERVRAALADNHAAVDDFQSMRTLFVQTIDDLERAAPALADTVGAATVAEEVAFLKWVEGGRFVFLGARAYDYPRSAEGAYAAEEPVYDHAAGLGVLRDPNNLVLRRSSEPSVLASSLRWRTEVAAPVVVAKANLRSRVHRRAYMDYIGVRRHGPSGEPVGETRFVGLFTDQAYEEPAHEIPLLRDKIDRVMADAGFPRGGHNAVRLESILETYPRRRAPRHSARHPPPARQAEDKAVRSPRPLRPFRLDPALCAAGALRRATARAGRRALRARLRRPCHRLHAELFRSAAGAHPLHHRSAARRRGPAGHRLAGSRGRSHRSHLGRRFRGGGARRRGGAPGGGEAAR